MAARFFVLALLGLALYLLYLIFKPFLPAIAWAIFLATAFYPVYRWLVGKLRGRAWTAAVATTALVVTLVVLPGVFLVLSVARSVPQLLAGYGQQRAHDASAAQPTAEGAPPGETMATTSPPRMPFIAELEEFLGRYVDVRALDLQGAATSSLQRLGGTLAAQGAAFFQNVLWAALSFLITALTMVFMLREGPRFLAACRELLPLQAQDKDAVFRLLHEVTRAVFYGVMMTAVVQAITGTIGWMIAGLPAPLTFGIAMFFCALLPVGGTALVWGPGALYLLLSGHPGRATFLLLWGALLVGLMDNVLRPLFMSRGAGMHALLVFFGIFGGIAAFGFVGLFAGPMVIALTLFLVEVVRRDLFQMQRTGLPEPDS